MTDLRGGGTSLDPRRSALVAVDLQRGVTGGRSFGPHSADDVVGRSARLAAAFRAVGGPVVWVRVAFSPDLADALRPPADQPSGSGGVPPGFSDLDPRLQARDTDLIVTKRQWGAFYGTDLDLQLRRRRIDTVVLTGIATNFGVESTARDAWERGFSLVLVEDAMTSMDAQSHYFAVQRIFPLIGRVRSTVDVLAGVPTS